MTQLKTILPYLRPYRWGIAAGLLLVVVSNGFQIALPQILGLAIDALEATGTTARTIGMYAGLVIVVALLGGAARFGMRELLNGLSRRVETDLRDAFFEHLLRLDATFYGRIRTGDLMSRATNDVQAVRQAVGPAVMYLVNTTVLTALSLIFMLRISPRLTLLALIPMLVLPPLVLWFGRLIHRRFERIQDHLGRLSTMVQENLAGVRIVRAYTQESAQAAEFERLNAGYLERNMALARTEGVFRPLLTLLAGLGMVIVLWIGGLHVIDGNISVGDFVAFGFYLNMLTWPMVAFGWVINLFQRGAASMGRINEVLGTRPRVRPPARPVQLERIRGAIEFRDVRFRYPDTERDVLSEISFEVPAGRTVALVGPTGSGKSTLISLLVRLYDPTEGEILLDGVPLTELPLERVRGAVGLVPQDTFLFSETIAENIALGLSPDEVDEVEDERVASAAGIAQLAGAIADFPHGYETRLGERGVNLSGGQRQRAALARAIAREPRILILDDSLSAVDTQTETRILSGLRTVLADRTALIVSHRVTAVKDADQILVLDGGRIVERGTHDGLVARGGLYASLLRRQLIAEDLEGDRPARSLSA